MLVADDSEFLRSILRSYPGSRSLVLIGSRARGDFTEHSDYDFYIVLSNQLAILFYPKLRSIRRSLEERYDAHVNIVPLTVSRIRNGNDIFLLRIRNEGKILAGMDIRDEIRIRELTDLPVTELLLNCFAGGMHLLSASSSFIKGGAAEKNNLSNDCLKALRLFRDVTSALPKDDSLRTNSETGIDWAQRSAGDPSIKSDLLWSECRQILISLVIRFCYPNRQDASPDELAKGIIELNEGNQKTKKNLVGFFVSLLEKKGNAFDFLRPDVLSISEITILQLLLSFNPKSDFKIMNSPYLTPDGVGFIRISPEKTITASAWESIVKETKDRWEIASLRV